MLLNCCNSDTYYKAKFNTPDSYFEKAEMIHGVKLDEKYPVMFSFNCFYTSEGFLGSMDFPEKGLIHLSDLNTGKIISSVCHKGRGPKELLTSNPQIDIYNNMLYVTDVITDRIKRVRIDCGSLVAEDIAQIRYNKPTITANAKVINDSLFVIFGALQDCHQILLCNKNGTIVDSVDYHILNDNSIDFSKVGTFYVSMHLSTCRQYLYVCNKTFNHVKKYHIRNNRINHVSTYFLTEPKYSVKKGKLVTSEDNVKFSGNIFINDRYIYIVANPESRRDFLDRVRIAQKRGDRVTALPDNNTYLLVFNHQMELVKRFHCNTQFETIALTPDPCIIYASDYRSHGLTKYSLHGLD